MTEMTLVIKLDICISKKERVFCLHHFLLNSTFLIVDLT